MPSKPRINKIFAAARQIGWDRDHIYDLVQQVSGGTSVKALTDGQADQVIDTLVRSGAQGKRKPSGRRTAANETLLITPGQRELIADLRDKLGGKWLEEAYFQGACQRLIKKPHPTTAGNAERVIEMCKARLAHREKTGR